jgi:hypothetical protein
VVKYGKVRRRSLTQAVGSATRGLSKRDIWDSKMKIVAPLSLCLSLSLILASLPGRSEFPTLVSGNSCDTSNGRDTLGEVSQTVADDYVRTLALTSWSMDLAQWIGKHRYAAAVDTFQQGDYQQWEFEKYCFKTRIERNELTTEYSFFDNGDYSNPKAILQQVVIFDRRTKRNAEIGQRVWDTISDSLTKRYGAPTAVPKDDMLTPFHLGAILDKRQPRFWQDNIKRIVLAEYFRFEGGPRTDFIMLLSRERALDSLLHRNEAVEHQYSGVVRGDLLRAEICDSVRLTKTPLNKFCGSDASAKGRLADLIQCGNFVADAERTGDFAGLPLYRMALYAFGELYSPKGNGDGSGPWRDVDTLKHYNVVFEWSHLGGGWEYSYAPLIDIYTKFYNSHWGQLAFLILQNSGWCPDGMCNGNNGPEVVSKGEEFLKRYPESSYTPAILLTIAKGHETNWNVSTCKIESPYMYDAGYRSDETSRQLAIAKYERILTEYPKSPEAEIAKVRLPRLKLGINSGRSDYFFIYD